jgi:hypothetical protein
MLVESNFHAWLTNEAGLVVPGSHRNGHNVFTESGREWLKQVIVWASIGSNLIGDDVPQDERRLRWIGVGSGTLLELTSVGALMSPLSITVSPTMYLRVLGTRAHAIDSAVSYTTSFLGSGVDFDHHGSSVTISEAGIFVDVDSGSGPGLDPSVSVNAPVAYKSFAPLTKLAAQTLTISWEFRF